MIDIAAINKIEDKEVLEEELENLEAALEENAYDMNDVSGVTNWFADFAK